MSGKYFIDADKFTIDKFRSILKTKDVLPGRMMLIDKIDERFDLIKSKGIHSLSDLLKELKTKPKVEKFAKDTGLSVDYLTILRREANSYFSVPLSLIDLPFLETGIIDKLHSAGIINSKQLLDHAAKRIDRGILANRYKLPQDKLYELVQLSDLVRIPGVGPVFARIILDSGIGSVKDFLALDSTDLFERLTKTNSENGLTKARFTIKDIEYCKELGKDLPFIFES